MLSKIQIMLISTVVSVFLVLTSSTLRVLSSSSHTQTSRTPRSSPNQSPVKSSPTLGRDMQPPSPRLSKVTSLNTYPNPGTNSPVQVVYSPAHPSQYGKCPDTKRFIITYPRTWTHTPNITPPLCSDIKRPKNLYGKAKDNWDVYLDYCSNKLKDQRSNYRPESPIGKGSEGYVWAATSINVPKSFPDARVAIKCAYTIQNLLVESAHLEAASASGHPNIVRYLGTFGFVESTQEELGLVHRPVACLVQEWVRGGNLRMVTDNGMFGGQFARRMLPQLVAALVHIHSLGMVHRDVQPANAFVDMTGTLKLGDFGLATYISSIMDRKPEIVKLYPDEWEESSLPMAGYDPCLWEWNFGKDVWPNAINGPKAFFRTEVYAVGSFERRIITRESQSGVEKPGMPRWLADDPEALAFYELTRLPMEQRPELIELQRHPFLKGHSTNTAMKHDTGHF